MRTWKFMAAVCSLVFLLALGQGVPQDDFAPAQPPATATAAAAQPARPAKQKAVKRVYIMTDLEGVAGVRDSEQWCGPDGRYYDAGQRLLTLEVNAAIEGFFAGGATEIVVADGHGRGAVNFELLDPRAQLERGWPGGWPGPSLAAGGVDAVAWVGQHAKAGTEHAHLAHTQGWNYVDLSINGVSIGEFGQLALCASELGARSIFASGDKAFSEEAKALVPGIETVWVKRGTTPGRGDELTAEQYGRRNTAAVHLHPEKVRALIRAGAERAIRRAQKEKFGIAPLKRPFEMITRMRPDAKCPYKRIAILKHPRSVAGVLNMRGVSQFKPYVEDK
jgi:D-amino peptidase